VVGLLGGNEMRPGCLAFDRALLAAAANPSKVCVVPTAVVRNGSVTAAISLARRYFGELGLEVVHVELHRRSDSSDSHVVRELRGSPLTYLLGGDPGYLLDTLREAPAWDAVAAALAVTEHVIARTEAALLRTGPTAEALAAARAEWAQLRNDLVPTGRLIRATMLQVAH